MDWTDIVTALVAVYGAGLATYNLIAQLRSSKARIKVEISLGFLTYPLGELSEPMVILSALNVGQKAVTLCSQGFLLPNGKKLVFPNPLSNVRFPHELLPGKSCQIWTEAARLARDLNAQGYSCKVKLVGFYRDEIDTIYKSKPYEFDVENWAKRS